VVSLRGCKVYSMAFLVMTLFALLVFLPLLVTWSLSDTPVADAWEFSNIKPKGVIEFRLREKAERHFGRNDRETDAA
jgi:hypothetical protein